MLKLYKKLMIDNVDVDVDGIFYKFHTYMYMFMNHITINNNII